MLKSLFDPSKADAWKEAANKIGAEFVNKGFFKKSIILNRYKNWTIRLKTISKGESNIVYTQLQVPIVALDNLAFSIFEESYSSNIAKMFNYQDIQINDLKFDNKYIIKGNDEKQIKRLLEDTKIKRSLMMFEYSYFRLENSGGEWGNDLPSNVHLLSLEVLGTIKDISEIESLFNVLKLTLEKLEQIGSIQYYPPNVTLR